MSLLTKPGFAGDPFLAVNSDLTYNSRPMEENLYQKLGGDVGLRKLVDRFYELMHTLPETQAIRKMHPEDISGSADKLYMFLSGWTGGPQLFVEKFGHPMLRRRHFPFAIGEAERDQWLLCMKRALDETGLEQALRDRLYQAFEKLADHMRNQ